MDKSPVLRKTAVSPGHENEAPFNELYIVLSCIAKIHFLKVDVRLLAFSHPPFLLLNN